MDQPIENNKGVTGSLKWKVQSSREMSVFICIGGMATGRIKAQATASWIHIVCQETGPFPAVVCQMLLVHLFNND